MNDLQKMRVAVAEDALAQVMAGLYTPVAGLPMGWIPDRTDIGCFVVGMNRSRCRLGVEDIMVANPKGGLSHFEGWPDKQDWVRAFPVARERMIAMLQNLIRNNGEFNPADIRPIEAEATIPTADFKNDATSGVVKGANDTAPAIVGPDIMMPSTEAMAGVAGAL